MNEPAFDLDVATVPFFAVGFAASTLALCTSVSRLVGDDTRGEFTSRSPFALGFARFGATALLQHYY